MDVFDPKLELSHDARSAFVKRNILMILGLVLAAATVALFAS